MRLIDADKLISRINKEATAYDIDKAEKQTNLSKQLLRTFMSVWCDKSPCEFNCQRCVFSKGIECLAENFINSKKPTEKEVCVKNNEDL